MLAEHAARHDRDGTWVAESFQHVQDAGLLAIAVPTELGGEGATIREVAMVQRELAKHCGSTALASSMHQHVTAFTAWRYRRGLPGAEATLRRIVDDGIVLVSTGGGDFTRPRGEAVKVDGGYRVSGRKMFASQSPAGDVLSTMFVYDDPERGKRVLNMAVPVKIDGVTVHDNWDTLGMRGTGSNDVTIENVFVPDERVLADRPYDVLDPPLQVIASIAFSIILGVYLGVAESARDYAIASVSKPTDPSVQRQVGLMNNRLQVAAWALDGALGGGRRRPDPVDGDGRRRDGGQARDLAGRHRGLRHRDGARRRTGVLQGLADRACLPRHPSDQVPPALARSDSAARRSAGVRVSRVSRCRRAGRDS